MKNRNSWVSNSSSTSFVVIGKKLKGVQEIDFDSGKRYIGLTWEFADQGADMVVFTPEILARLEEKGFLAFEVWQVEQEVYEIKKEIELSGTYDVGAYEVSFHTMTTVEDVENFLERF